MLLTSSVFAGQSSCLLASTTTLANNFSALAQEVGIKKVQADQPIAVLEVATGKLVYDCSQRLAGGLLGGLNAQGRYDKLYQRLAADLPEDTIPRYEEGTIAGDEYCLLLGRAIVEVILENQLQEAQLKKKANDPLKLWDKKIRTAIASHHKQEDDKELIELIVEMSMDKIGQRRWRTFLMLTIGRLRALSKGNPVARVKGLGVMVNCLHELDRSEEVHFVFREIMRAIGLTKDEEARALMFLTVLDTVGTNAEIMGDKRIQESLNDMIAKFHEVCHALPHEGNKAQLLAEVSYYLYNFGALEPAFNLALSSIEVATDILKQHLSGKGRSSQIDSPEDIISRDPISWFVKFVKNTNYFPPKERSELLRHAMTKVRWAGDLAQKEEIYAQLVQPSP